MTKPTIKSPRKKPKKCPVCQSTRFTESKEGMACKKCGYVNKTTEKINEELKFKNSKSKKRCSLFEFKQGFRDAQDSKQIKGT